MQVRVNPHFFKVFTQLLYIRHELAQLIYLSPQAKLKYQDQTGPQLQSSGHSSA